MSIIIFDPAAFRAAFPEFANVTTYPDATLQYYFNNAICMMSDDGAFGRMQDTTDNQPRSLGLNLLTAHLARLNTKAAAGKNNGLVDASAIDKISVTLQPPPGESQFQWWLNLTPYGQQLYALLQVYTVTGFYVGGLPELDAFRKVGGWF